MIVSACGQTCEVWHTSNTGVIHHLMLSSSHSEQVLLLKIEFQQFKKVRVYKDAERLQ